MRGIKVIIGPLYIVTVGVWEWVLGPLGGVIISHTSTSCTYIYMYNNIYIYIVSCIKKMICRYLWCYCQYVDFVA